MKRGTGAAQATTIPSFRSYSNFTGSQPMDRDYLICLAWLALWPAGATLEGLLVCFARRVRGSSRCLVDRLPGQLLAAGLMALQTSQPVYVCSAAPKHTDSLTHSFTNWPGLSLASRREAKVCSVTVPNTI